MEISKLTDARRNLDKMKDYQRDVQRLSSDLDRQLENIGRLVEETSRYIVDVESELKRMENK